MTDLSTLLAERDIIALAVRYAAAIDEKDWDRFRTCFTPEVAIDSSALRGVPPSTLGVDAWVARVRSSVEAFDVTLHYLSNQQVTIRGDEAGCYSYMYAQHLWRPGGVEERFVVHGAYTHAMRRTADGWRIGGVKIDFKIRDGVMPPPKQPTPVA
jgi:3-phenylpropionate/cinnamic acid dioxygenase small subunit